MRNGSRTIKVSKTDLIEKVKENRKAHIENYGKAVVAYKKEAYKQLNELKEMIDDDKLEIYLNLTLPINNTKQYDSLLETLEWEVNAEVELSPTEFQEYVQDKTSYSESVNYANSVYLSHG